ncbi:hypothetical protein, partial [Klebsiella pneumoniae]|uniref:hypothetical protein n=1 Tax=Klebsiella pneumoniae TaxID=573 RepID=UPI0024DDFE63
WTRPSIGNKTKVKAEQRETSSIRDEDVLSIIEGMFHHATRIKLGGGYAKRHPSSNPTPERKDLDTQPTVVDCCKISTML